MVAVYLPAQLEAISFHVLVQSRFTLQMTEYAPLTTISAHKHFEALCYMVTFSLHKKPTDVTNTFRSEGRGNFTANEFQENSAGDLGAVQSCWSQVFH